MTHGTMETRSDGVEDYQEAFARIEEQVRAGNTDLGRLGFWRLIRRIKPDPALSEHWADVAGGIDRAAFERRVRIRLPMWAGHIVAVLALVILSALVPVGLGVGRGGETWGLSFRANPLLGGALVVLAAVGLSVAAHGPAHWIAGRLGRIRFSGWFIGGPLRVTPGVKIDYASYLRASPGARAAMHAAGALASKAAPIAVFIPVYLEHRAAGYALLPSWSLWAVLGFALFQIVTDIVWSRKYSDWKKVGRELRLARSQRAG